MKKVTTENGGHLFLERKNRSLLRQSQNQFFVDIKEREVVVFIDILIRFVRHFCFTGAEHHEREAVVFST